MEGRGLCSMWAVRVRGSGPLRDGFLLRITMLLWLTGVEGPQYKVGVMIITVVYENGADGRGGEDAASAAPLELLSAC